ncbi:hypothetical protein [Blastococcus montanus]|uniref:hypothetical protein n=1 Tax=Blastococcus montanus TaxID=3144973 RepID=UPI00320B238A
MSVPGLFRSRITIGNCPTAPKSSTPVGEHQLHAVGGGDVALQPQQLAWLAVLSGLSSTRVPATCPRPRLTLRSRASVQYSATQAVKFSPPEYSPSRVMSSGSTVSELFGLSTVTVNPRGATAACTHRVSSAS